MKWTDDQIGVLRAMYPTCDTAEVANLLGRTRRACMLKACQLGISKTREGKRTWTAHVQLPSTWGFGKDPGRYNRGKPSPNRQPIGSEFVSSKGEVYVKVACTGKKNRDWRRKAHVVWERRHGPLPEGSVISFADGDSLNCSPENLRLSSKAEIMQDNSIHNLPPEIVQLYRAKGQIIRAINRRNK